MAPSYTPRLGRILYPLLHTLMEPMRSRFRSEEHQKRSCAIQSVRPGQQQASSSCLPAEGFKMPALNRASILHPACSWQAGQSRQAAPVPWHPMPHCRLQVDGGNCSKKCFSTSLPPPVLEILKYISAHSLLYSSWPVHQIWQILLHTPYLKETTWSFTTPFHNGIFHGQFHWRLIQMCTNRHVYFELSLKSTGRVLSFSNCEPSPSTFLPIFQT